jgi:hypothetical protein
VVRYEIEEQDLGSQRHVSKIFSHGRLRPLLPARTNCTVQFTLESVLSGRILLPVTPLQNDRIEAACLNH